MRKKIVNGMKVDFARYPFLAALLKTNRSNNYLDCLCGSSILSQRWILTAGHCIVYDKGHKLHDTKKLQVLVGSLKCFNFVTGTLINITRFFIHPEYNILV